MFLSKLYGINFRIPHYPFPLPENSMRQKGEI
jgi:hypothetical protein